MKNRATGAYMNHEVGSASNLNQTLVMSAKDYRQKDENKLTGGSSVQMKITEDVREGRVSIGVVQGNMPGGGLNPSATAWRNPSLEIEEDYAGTFHVEKNMSIQVPTSQIMQNYSWLPCCPGGYFDIQEYSSRYSSAEKIFDSNIA